MSQVLMELPQRQRGRPSGDEALVAFSSVFSQSASTRVAILRVLNGNAAPVRFKDLLDQVRSEDGEESLSPQNLTYHLKDLKSSKAIDQDSSDRYSITSMGYFLLNSFSQLSQELKKDTPKLKPGFVGELSATISHKNFDCNVLVEELESLPFFVKVPTMGDDFTLKWRDTARDLESEVILGKDGSIYAKVIIYHDLIRVQGSFSEDMEKTSEWYDAARAIAHVIYFYVKRASLKLWSDAEIKMTVEDAYGINLFSGMN